MDTLNQIDCLDRLSRDRFTPSNKYKNWYEFVPLSSSLDKDIEILKSLKSSNVIANIVLKSTYFKDGLGLLELERLLNSIELRGIYLPSIYLDKFDDFNWYEVVVLEFHDFIGSPYKSNSPVNLSGFKFVKSISLPVSLDTSSLISSLVMRQIKFLEFAGSKAVEAVFLERLHEGVELTKLTLHRPKDNYLKQLKHLEKLKYLEINYAKNLVDVNFAEELHDLTAFEFQNCPKLVVPSFLMKREKLLAAAILRCKGIESITGFSNSLRSLNFLGTPLLDKNLSPLATAKQLRQINFDMKRDYVFQESQLEEIKIKRNNFSGRAWDVIFNSNDREFLIIK